MDNRKNTAEHIRSNNDIQMRRKKERISTFLPAGVQCESPRNFPVNIYILAQYMTWTVNGTRCVGRWQSSSSRRRSNINDFTNVHGSSLNSLKHHFVRCWWCEGSVDEQQTLTSALTPLPGSKLRDHSYSDCCKWYSPKVNSDWLSGGIHRPGWKRHRTGYSVHFFGNNSLSFSRSRSEFVN